MRTTKTGMAHRPGSTEADSQVLPVVKTAKISGNSNTRSNCSRSFPPSPTEVIRRSTDAFKIGHLQVADNHLLVVSSSRLRTISPLSYESPSGLQGFMGSVALFTEEQEDEQLAATTGYRSALFVCLLKRTTATSDVTKRRAANGNRRAGTASVADIRLWRCP